ncbi:hypothetical protein HHI36_017200 [Cryptolaemus montrouzieri]|uniref:Uncharacterized protein n=1 Tax=Cryptolaemus montrouzieri TaxID=559131 RepID=A0ABD2NMD2_9CUCU
MITNTAMNPDLGCVCTAQKAINEHQHERNEDIQETVETLFPRNGGVGTLGQIEYSRLARIGGSDEIPELDRAELREGHKVIEKEQGPRPRWNNSGSVRVVG